MPFPMRGQVVVANVPGPSLVGNRLDDPTVREIPIYLPPNYADGDRRYPVIYYLPGFAGRARAALNVDSFSPNNIERLDAMIAAGEAPPAIMVVADDFTTLGGAQYINSPLQGNYADFVTGDLISYVDSNYRTVADRSGRAIMGKSSGGFGAIWLAMHYPGLYAACASHSGDLYFTYSLLSDFPRAANDLHRAGGVANFLRDFAAAPNKGRYFSTYLTIGMAACYSPARTLPQPLPHGEGSLYAPVRDDAYWQYVAEQIELPFDIYSGEVVPEVWARWLAHDPVNLLAEAQYADALRGLKLLYLDCGTRDEHHLHLGARIFSRKLQALGITHVHEEFDDGHSGTNYRTAASFGRLKVVFENTL